MGFEYKISSTRVKFDFEYLEKLKNLKSFWKKAEKYDTYLFGKEENSNWPEFMVCFENGEIGVTLNGSSATKAWQEFCEIVEYWKSKDDQLSITDWDSDENLSDEFFKNF